MTKSDGIFYTIAKNWETVSDDDVLKFKRWFYAYTNSHYGTNFSPETNKCRGVKWWLMGTYIDIFVKVEDKEDVHFAIDREDTIVIPVDVPPTQQN